MKTQKILFNCSILLVCFSFIGCYTQLAVQKKIYIEDNTIISNNSLYDDQSTSYESDTIVVEDGESVTIINNYSSFSLDPYDDYWRFNPYVRFGYNHHSYGMNYYSYYPRSISTHCGFDYYWYDSYVYDPFYFSYTGYYGLYNSHWNGNHHYNWYPNYYDDHYEKKKRNWERRGTESNRETIVRTSSQNSENLANVVTPSNYEKKNTRIVRHASDKSNTSINKNDQRKIRKNKSYKKDRKEKRVIIRNRNRNKDSNSRNDKERTVQKRKRSNTKMRTQEKKKKSNRMRKNTQSIFRTLLNEVVSTSGESFISKPKKSTEKSSKSKRSRKQSSGNTTRRSR